MMMCKVTNVTSMNVVIEDLGIRLEPAGGRNSSIVIRADVADKSADLVRVEKWIRLDRFEIVQPSSAMSVSVSVQPVAPAAPASVPAPAPAPASVPAPVPAASDSAEIEHLRKTLEDMRARQEELFAFLMSTRQPAYQTSQPVSVVKPLDQDMAVEEILLPGKIVPEVSSANVQAKETEVSKDDFDSALLALKKARSKV